jgi:hypothetical protein
VNAGFQVTTTIEHAHPKLDAYPLLPGDLIVREPDGTWMKEAPGLAVGGFVLSEAQEAALEPVEFVCAGLNYAVVSPHEVKP